ncbi:hypothetical protein EVAR_59303_1 [Eumeta japonica]|uniref:Uncharacterized protein n=1 Tax=Eumeta variegata TaxID=151549 RepID=A0A4C1YCW6_EUMVA|nr:hypothetical protein EVAR_59303_1 [Eumeta japonica]
MAQRRHNRLNLSLAVVREAAAAGPRSGPLKSNGGNIVDVATPRAGCNKRSGRRAADANLKKPTEPKDKRIGGSRAPAPPPAPPPSPLLPFSYNFQSSEL